MTHSAAKAARQFHRAVQADDLLINAAIPEITAPLKRRLASKPNLRPETVTDTVRSWQTLMPSSFRFDIATAPGKSAVSISELRLTASRWCLPGRDIEDTGISVVLINLSTNGGKVTLELRPVAAVSIFALELRFQRGDGRADENIMRDLTCLAVPPVGNGNAVATGTGGSWVGRVLRVNDDTRGRQFRMRAIRTFVA